MKIASLCMAMLAMLAMLLKVAKRRGKVAKQECQVNYNNNNNLRLRVPRLPRKTESGEKATFKSAKSAKSMARLPRDDERPTKGKHQEKATILQTKRSNNCSIRASLKSRFTEENQIDNRLICPKYDHEEIQGKAK
jgi:hypothetical protein